MDFEDLVKVRRSCRNFDINKEVDDSSIDKIINAGLNAPTGMNSQNTIIIAVKDRKKRDQLSKINAMLMKSDKDPFYGAPIVLLVASKKSPLAIYDGAATIENMLLQATDLGLSTCWIHRAKEELESKEGKELFKELKINLDEYEGIGHVILGYPNPDNKVAPKTIKDNRVFKL